jgi:hypothetical protein
VVTIAITGMTVGYVPAVVALSIACLVCPNKGLRCHGDLGVAMKTCGH